MNREEFQKALTDRGCCNKNAAEKYVQNHFKESYSEEDFAEAWRTLNPEYMRNKPVKKRPFDEENWIYGII